jgi:hypothetical protein
MFHRHGAKHIGREPSAGRCHPRHTFGHHGHGEHGRENDVDQQDVENELGAPGSRELLASTSAAHLAYIGKDGTLALSVPPTAQPAHAVTMPLYAGDADRGTRPG